MVGGNMDKNERFRKKAEPMVTKAMRNIRGILGTTYYIRKGILQSLSESEKEEIISNLRSEIKALQKEFKK